MNASLGSFLVLPHAIDFCDPEAPADIAVLGCFDHEAEGLFQERQLEPARQPDNDDASVVPRRIAKGIGEVLVERDKAAVLGSADAGDVLVWRGCQLLLRDRGNVESSSLEELGAGSAEVLV
jgi:hypothetical protein